MFGEERVKEVGGMNDGSMIARFQCDKRSWTTAEYNNYCLL